MLHEESEMAGGGQTPGAPNGAPGVYTDMLGF